MSSSTPNIGLTLPIGTEKVSRQIINTNMTKIDTAIGNINRATMRPVPFTIAVADWSGSGSNWTATFLTAYVTTTSQEILTFDSSINTSKARAIDAAKKSGGGGIVFTTTKKPTGSVSGMIYAWDTDDGKIPVIIEGTVTPIANGGTGASNVTGAKNNLGITAVENSVATLNNKFEWNNSGAKDISTGFQVPSWAKEAIVQGTKNTSQSFSVWEVVSVHIPIIGEANNSSASGYGSTMLTVYINSSNQLSIVQSATSNIAYYRVFYR